MHPADVATIVIAAVAVVTLVVAVVGWFFKRGADEREFSVALKDCASAVRELASEFRGFRDTVIGELHQLDIRVTKHDAMFEAIKDDRTPPDRDARSKG